MNHIPHPHHRTTPRRGLAVVLAVVSTLVSTLVISASPGAAEPGSPLWRLPTPLVPASGNYLAFTADPSAATTAEGIRLATDADTDLTLSGSNGTATLTSRNDQFWSLRVEMPRGVDRFAVGQYEDAHRFRSTTAGVDFEGEGRGCMSVDGRLEIMRADYSGRTLVRLAGRFEQVCPHETTRPSYGEFSWSADAVIPPAPNPVAPVPTGLWQPPPGAVPTTGNYTYVSGYLPPTTPASGDLLLDGGVGWPAEPPDAPPSSRLGFVGISGNKLVVDGTIVGPDRAGALREGLYRDLDGHEYDNPVTGGLGVTVNGYSCGGTVDSWFAIDELTRVGREITHIVFRFERTCDHWYDEEGVHPDVVRGQVRWDAAPSITAMDPASGPRRGGTPISFTGADLTGVTSATVGGVDAEVQYNDFNQLRVITPPLPLGRHDVVVHAAGGTATIGGDQGFLVVENQALAPNGVEATPMPLGATVSWTPPDDLGDDDITGVEVELWNAPFAEHSLPEVTITATPGDTSAVVAPLPEGPRYVATVTYISANGRGDRSSPTDAIDVLPPDVTPFDGVPALVTQQYVDFTGRAPTTSERSAAVANIRAGKVAPEGYVASMRNRPEWGGVRAPMTRLYSAYFGRLPDTAGLTYWSKKLRTGTSLAKASATFAASSEFKRKYGSLSNGAFVDLVYRNVLHRKADPSGRTYWIRKLNSGGARGTVMVNFSESSEHVRKMAPTVDAVLLYTGMLRRMPSKGELPSAASDSGRAVAPVSPSGPVALAEQLRRSTAYAARF